MRSVSVCIPTFRRPDGFLRAARSVLAQEGAHIEIIGVDNSPEHSARAAFAQFAEEAGGRFRAAHERRAGVSHARNAALANASHDIIVWLDDDEEAAPGWLAALLRVQAETDADVVFGPVDAAAPSAPDAQRAYFERLYARSGPDESGLVDKPYGAGNSLMRRNALPSFAPFAIEANETGGEDDRLFAAMRAENRRFAWAHDARVIEHVASGRVNFAYAMRRAFAYGQGPCETAAAERDLVGLARHMCVGVGQSAVFGFAAVLAWIARSPVCWDLSDRAARGLGKALWFRAQKFYGAAG